MTPEAVAIADAFSEPVREAGLQVRTGQATEPITVHLVVSDLSRGDHVVAVFEAADNEYIGVRLDNGAHFWEHEWDQPFREAFAALVGAAVVEHVAGRGTYENGAYGLTVGDEYIQTSDPVDQDQRL